MSILNPFAPPKTPPMCAKCQNRGYHELVMQPSRPEESPVRTMSFCPCENGLQLIQISKESRLNDLLTFGNPILNALREAENKWGRSKDEAKGIIRRTISSIEKMIKEAEEAGNPKVAENDQ